MKSLLIVKVGDALPDARARGDDFEHWIARGFGGAAAAAAAKVIDARAASRLSDPASVAGIVVTGSSAMVTERAAWSEALVPWLNAAVHAGTPVLGICYGHQLLAHALGGEVGYHPDGMEIGTVEVRKTAGADGDPLFAELPSQFEAQVVHSQSVRRLPDGAVCLAANAHEAHHAFRFGACAWGVQFHPEFDTEAVHGYVRKFAPDLMQLGQAPERIAAELRPTPAAASILQRFAQFALGSWSIDGRSGGR